MSGKKSVEKRALPVVLLTIFIDVLGLGILFPILPQLVLPGPNQMLDGFVIYGWLSALYPICQFIAAPILGQLSDRYGRRRVLAISLVGTAIGYAMFAVGIITKNVPLLFASRALDGLTGGNLPVAQAVVADVSTAKNRTRNFGLVGMMFGLGFALAPYIGGKLASPNVSFFGLFDTPSWFSLSTPFWLATALSAINVVLVLARLPHTRDLAAVEKIKNIQWTQALHNIRTAVTDKSLRTILIPMAFFFGGFGFFRSFFSIYLTDKLNFTVSNTADFFLYFGILIAVAQGTVVPLLAKKLKNHQALNVGLLLSGIFMWLYLWPSNTSELLLVPVVFAPAIGLVFANSVALVSASASKEVQGEVLGINSSVQALGDAIPSALSGYIAASLSVGSPVVFGAVTILFGALLFRAIYRPSQHKVTADPPTPLMAH